MKRATHKVVHSSPSNKYGRVYEHDSFTVYGLKNDLPDFTERRYRD